MRNKNNLGRHKSSQPQNVDTAKTDETRLKQAASASAKLQANSTEQMLIFLPPTYDYFFIFWSY